MGKKDDLQHLQWALSRSRAGDGSGQLELEIRLLDGRPPIVKLMFRGDRPVVPPEDAGRQRRLVEAARAALKGAEAGQLAADLEARMRELREEIEALDAGEALAGEAKALAADVAALRQRVAQAVPPGAAVRQAEASLLDLRTELERLGTRAREVERLQADPLLVMAMDGAKRFAELEAEGTSVGQRREQTANLIKLAEGGLARAKAAWAAGVELAAHQADVAESAALLLRQGDAMRRLEEVAGPLLDEVAFCEAMMRVSTKRAVADAVAELLRDLPAPSAR